ncbi:hypothetical protein [Streptomyces sp. B21-083]|uniref:hypothetical protein n=1 Tax=Streptomyces sp. B21-083 TaxID=3039410 RepID=UPI002FF38852
MSSPLAETSAPGAEPAKKPRLRGRRILTAASVLLALLGGAVAQSDAALAQSPPGTCGSCTIPPVPNGVSATAWNEAFQAASFWANHYIDFNSVVRYNLVNSVYRLEPWRNRGWPGPLGGRWLGYAGGNNHNRYIYTGGTYNDYNTEITRLERGRGVPSSDAYPTGPRRSSPYVEYDVNDWAQPWGVPNRGGWRLVRNHNNGHVYVTFDHYDPGSFHYLTKM